MRSNNFTLLLCFCICIFSLSCSKPESEVIPPLEEEEQPEVIECPEKKIELPDLGNWELETGGKIPPGRIQMLDIDRGFLVIKKHIILKTADRFNTLDTAYTADIFSIDAFQFFDENNWLVFSNFFDSLGYPRSKALKTTTGGKKWEPFLEDHPLTEYWTSEISFEDDSIGFLISALPDPRSPAGHQNIRAWRTIDGGQHWEDMNLRGLLNYIDRPRLPIQFASKKIGFAAHNRSFYRTTDSGRSWEDLGKDNIRDFYLVNEKLIYAADFHRIIRSEDGGTNWDTIIPHLGFILAANETYFLSQCRVGDGFCGEEGNDYYQEWAFFEQDGVAFRQLSPSSFGGWPLLISPITNYGNQGFGIMDQQVLNFRIRE